MNKRVLVEPENRITHFKWLSHYRMQHFILCVCNVKQHTSRQRKEQSSLLPFSSLTHNPSLLREHAAAAAAKSLQSCPNLCDPIDGSPQGSLVPGILQARTLEWVAISFSNAGKWKVRVKSLSHVQLLVTPWTAAYEAPPSMGFSRQEYWSGVPLPSPKRACTYTQTVWHIPYRPCSLVCVTWYSVRNMQCCNLHFLY